MIGRFQNRCDRNDGSFQGYIQSQFNYHDQIPHYGLDFNYAGGTSLPHQTSGPTIPAVAPLQQPQPAAPLHHPQPAAPLHHPQPAAPLRHPQPAAPVRHPQPAAPVCHPQPAAPLHHPQPAAPLRHPQPAAPLRHPQPPLRHPQPPLHQPQPAAPLRHPQPAAPLRHPQPAAPLRRPQPAAPLRRPQPAAPLHRPHPAAPLHQPQPPLHQPQPAAPSHQPQPAAPSHQPQPAAPSHQPQPAAPLRQPQPPVHQPQPAAPLHQPQPAALSHQPQPAAPSHQPQPAAPSHQPQPAAPSHQPQPAAPSHQPQPAAPSHQPQPAAPSHQPQPAAPLRQPQPAAPLRQPQPAVPLHQPQPAAPLRQPQPPLHQPQPAGPSHQPQPAARSHQPQPAAPSPPPQPAAPSHQPQPAAPSPQPHPAAPSHQPQPAAPLHQAQPAAPLHRAQPAVPLHQPQQAAYCKICEVKVGTDKNVEVHNNGKQHRRMLELLEESERPRTSNRQIPNSEMNVAQPKTFLKSGKNGYRVKYTSSEVTIAKHENYLQKNIGVTSKVPAEGLEGKPRDNTGAQGRRRFKRKIGQNSTVEMNNQPHYPADSNINVQTDNTGAQGHRSFKRKFGQNPTVEMNNQAHAPADSNINAQTEGASSVPAAIAIEPPKGLMASKVFASPPLDRYCKICEVTFPKFMKLKHLEMHNNGKRHQRMLGLKRLKTSNGQIPNSRLNSAVQPRTVQKSGKRKNYLQKDIGATSEVRAQGPEGKRRDNAVAQGHGFKYKIIEVAKTGKCMKTNIWERRPMESSKSDVKVLSNSVEPLVQIPALPPPPGPVASQIMASKGKEHHEIQNPTVEINDQQHVPADSNVNTQTEGVSSDSAATAIVPPEGLRESRAFAPRPAVGSSFEPQIQDILQTEVSESKVHHEIQNPIVETNDQSQSISMELDAPADSDIDSQTEDASSDSGAIATGPPKALTESHTFTLPPAVGSSFEPQNQDVLETEVPQSKVHHEIQNPIVETNDQSHSISMELDDPAGSDIDYQTEDVSDDSAAIARGPASQVSKPPPAVGSGFEPQIQHILRIETEPQLSKAVTDCEGQNCTDEKNNQLLSSALVEYNVPSGSTTNTQTADGSSEAKHKTDVLTNQSGTTQLSKVAVCLTCGDKGFPETLVFCSKCQVYALHRYCLDGPVIFTDDVTWFCEDCEPKVVDSSSRDQCVLLPSGKSDSRNLANEASQARTHPEKCMKIVKKNKQKQQNIAAKTKVLLSDSHSLSQCNNICEKENKFGKECQPVPRDNTSEGSAIIAVPRPILDPVWRGYLCLRDRGFGLLAHMSTLACSKVLEETRLFPEVLSVDLFQRSVVWPKSFVKCRPNEDSIALYFFPDGESVERAFDKLVDGMISSDLAIRTVVENAELLVFPSTLLPIEYRRFQAKYYLWGVFRTLKTSSNTKVAACR